MRLTKSQLKKLIKEELANLLEKNEEAAAAVPPVEPEPAPMPSSADDGDSELVIEKIDRVLYILENAFPQHAKDRYDEPTPGYVD